MTTGIWRFRFDGQVPLTEVELTLHLALFAVEGLFGPARVRLDASYHLDDAGHALIVTGRGEVGEAVARIFTALALREFGEDAISVRRVDAPAAATGGRAA